VIDGVRVKQLRVIPDERGRLMEVLRSDDDLFIKFGQLYVTTIYPGVTKAWHYHLKQWDNFVAVRGMIKLVLYDGREDSPTRAQVDELFIGDWSQRLVQIPPGVYYGFKCISQSEAILINVPTEPYNYDEPDEFRVEPHGDDVPYDWERKDR
jgi:dTDP-4-dehydrorhamnose 3,5-epimerase